jgi:hypothetical protein
MQQHRRWIPEHCARDGDTYLRTANVNGISHCFRLISTYCHTYSE